MNDPDVLVIGGGIAGASTAYHLAGYGRRVLLVERGAIASQASGVNAGSIHAAGRQDGSALEAELTMGSLEIFKRFQLDLGHDIGFRQSGYLQAVHTEEQLAYAHERAMALHSTENRVEVLSARQVRAIEPGFNPDLLGALYLPLNAQADPVTATHAFAAEAQRCGAVIRTHTPVRALRQQTGGALRAITADDELEAGALVIAAGAWSSAIGDMLGLRIPIVPVRGQMWATEPLPPRVFHVISSCESALHWHRRPGADAETPPSLTHRGGLRLTRHLYGRQTRDGEIIFGGDRELVGYDTNPDSAGIAVNHGHAAEVLPFLTGLSIARTWAGVMPFPLDGRPLIGRIPARHNVFVVGGLASSGFGRGPMAGKLLADLIATGTPHPALAEADPARCVTERGTMLDA
jgi:glycine/D-amino acid oxidase-like deaminating enzyme